MLFLNIYPNEAIPQPRITSRTATKGMPVNHNACLYFFFEYTTHATIGDAKLNNVNNPIDNKTIHKPMFPVDPGASKIMTVIIVGTIERTHSISEIIVIMIKDTLQFF